jgi:hypothetical protein
MHLQVSKYRRVAQRLAGLLQHSLQGSFEAWHRATQHSSMQLARATQHWHIRHKRQLLRAWSTAASTLAVEAVTNAELADELLFERLGARAMLAWQEAADLQQQQRQGLCSAFEVVVRAEHKVCVVLVV